VGIGDPRGEQKAAFAVVEQPATVWVPMMSAVMMVVMLRRVVRRCGKAVGTTVVSVLHGFRHRSRYI
jgi:hypothetical protein